MKQSDPPVSVSIQTSSMVSAIWNALTSIDQMKEWYFNNIDQFTPEIGSKSSFLVENEGRQFTHSWEVTEVVPEKKISYTWHYPEYPGFAIVTFSIAPIDNHNNKVTVSLEVTEDFPQDIPEFKRESCQAGWEYYMNRLKSYLE